MKFKTLAICLLTSSGCTLSVPQLESAVSFIEGIVASKEAVPIDGPPTWLASVNGKGAVLTPYVANGLIVFANKDGDAIAFDGWTIRSVVGFGLKAPLSILDRDGVRTYVIADMQTLVNCDDWNRDGEIWNQTCSNGKGEIALDDKGNILKITMATPDGLGGISLRVVE